MRERSSAVIDMMIVEVKQVKTLKRLGGRAVTGRRTGGSLETNKEWRRGSQHTIGT